ncbi:MAG TPA: hypothetical protein DCO77_04315 [Nitrospiraceae bacterium]|nr:hypothetical protein [Nitrospiraceae bacterium]
MKKFLVLVAVFALAFSMGPVSDAFAEATVYGKIHMSVDYIDGDGAAGTQYEDPNLVVASNSTRIGFKGDQRLDNGMTLIWLLESSILADGEGVGNLGDRNRYVGVKGGIGTVMIGQHDTPMKKVGRSIALFPECVGDARNITAVGGWDGRVNNIIGYKNKFGPIDLFLLYSADTATDADNDYHGNSLYGASVKFKGGPLMVAGAFEKHHAAAGQISEAALRVAASFKLGDPLRLVGFLQKTEDEGNTAGNDRDTIGFGASFKLGDITLKGHMYMADDLGATADSGGKMFAVGAETKLSKATTAYVSIAKTDNDAGTGAFNINAGGHGDTLTGLANDQSPSAFSVGVIHNF